MKRKGGRAWLALVVAGGLVACAGPPPDAPAPTPDAAPPRVLLIGLDGADWEIIDPLAAAGLLPNLDRLRRQGASGVLRSEEPLLSPIVWTTIATGRGPLAHGIFGFLTRRAGATLPVGSSERRVRAAWNILSEVGQTVGVIGWYASWPAEPVTGYLISDQVAAHQVSGSAAAPAAGATWPAALAEVVAAEEELAASRVADVLARLVDGPPGEDETAMALAGVVRTTELYRALVPRLNGEFAPTLSAVYFEGTDAVGHLVGAHAPPALPWVDAAEARRYGQTFARFYAYVDEVVGSLVAGLDPHETTVVIVSDHGFRSGARRPLVASHLSYANRAAHWHRPEGVILLWGRGIRPAAAVAGATVYDVLPTVLRLVGAPLAATLEGRELDEALDAALPAATTVADYESRGPLPRAPLGEADWDGQVDKLRALGYLDDEGAAAPSGDGGGEGQDGVAVNRYNHGRILLAAGRSEEAAATMAALAAAFPTSVLGHLGCGIVALEEGQAPAAAVALKRAVQLAPDMTLAWELLAQAELVAGEPAAAWRAAERALALAPSSCRGLLVRGRLQLQTPAATQAAPLFERAAAVCEEPREQVEAMVGLAILAEARGDLDGAAATYARALVMDPASGWALERAANLAVVRGDGGTALELLERMVAATGRDARALTLYGQVLAAVGRYPEAELALREALQRDPGQTAAGRLLAKVEAARSGAPR